MRPRTNRKEELRPTKDKLTPICSSLLYGSPGVKDQVTYLTTRGTVKKGATIRPVVKSTKAKATMKYVAGARKHLRGSLKMVNSNNALLVIVMGDRTAKQMPVESCV